MKHCCMAPLLLLAGCAPLAPYKAAPDAALAQIKSELTTQGSYNEWLSVNVSTEAECLDGRQATKGKETALFSVHAGSSRPAGYLSVAAHQPLHLVVTGLASADRRCVIEFSTEFSAHTHYLLKGGIIENGGVCRIDIVNADTSASLAHFETPTQAPVDPKETYSWRQRMAHTGCYLQSPDKDRQP